MGGSLKLPLWQPFAVHPVWTKTCITSVEKLTPHFAAGVGGGTGGVVVGALGGVAVAVAVAVGAPPEEAVCPPPFE